MGAKRTVTNRCLPISIYEYTVYLAAVFVLAMSRGHYFYGNSADTKLGLLAHFSLRGCNILIIWCFW